MVLHAPHSTQVLASWFQNLAEEFFLTLPFKEFSFGILFCLILLCTAFCTRFLICCFCFCNSAEAGENSFSLGDMDAKFAEFDSKWWNNEAVCPAEIAFKGTTAEAVKSEYMVVPFGKIIDIGNVDLKDNQLLTCEPDNNSELSSLPWADGHIKKAETDGKACWNMGDDGSKYLYFAVDMDVAYKCKKPMAVFVNYYDSGEGMFTLVMPMTFAFVLFCLVINPLQ